MSRLILASSSASRRQILDNAGIPFEVIKPLTDEPALKRANPRLDSAELALMLAEEKALDVAGRAEPGDIVVGCDQVLEFEGRAYDKPKTPEELAARLADMAGRTHYLRGGMVAVKNGEVLDRFREDASLLMRKLRAEEIDQYVAAAPAWVLGTVGGYALEGLGARLFERVEGDHFTILGLPLFALLPVLRREGIVPW